MTRKAKDPVVAQFLRPDVFSICWDPEEVSSDVTEGMDVLAGGGHTGNKRRLPSSMPKVTVPSLWC